LKGDDEASQETIKETMTNNGTGYFGNELNEVINQAIQEYHLHIKGVQDAFKGFIYEYDCTSRPQVNVVGNDLAKMLRIRFRSTAPRRPPRVILLGPPGSGKTTQAQNIAQKFGLVHLCMKDMLKAEIQQKPHLGKVISAAIHKGEPVPDEICVQIMEQRLKQSDCKVNGFILDGFPKTEAQVNLLKAMRLKPSLVCLFEQTEQVSIHRLKHRRTDPQTGIQYNLESKQPTDELVEARLLEEAEDREEVVKKRYSNWQLNLSLMEETYKQMIQNIQSDKTPEQVEEQICEGIQNPLF